MNGWSTPHQGSSDYFGGPTTSPAPPGYGQQPPPPSYGQQPTGQPPMYGQQPAYGQQPGFGGPPPPQSGPSSTKIGLIIGGVVLAVVVGIGILAAVFVGSFTEAVPGGAGALFDELESGFTYGDNPTLDALWDECAAGAFDSCDALYFRSELDSEYEAFGDSCGGRNEPAGLCTSIYDGS